jgi:hypothetical protein
LAQIFPEWTNKLPLLAAIGGLLAALGIIGFFWYYGSPKYTQVGYRPRQPVAYSHKLHAGDLGIDCRYCHNFIEESPVANVPPTQTCMNCHKLIGQDNEKLLPVRESWASGMPIEWIRVHKLPDYVYFNHAAHLHAGVGCETCHGHVQDEEVIEQVKPLSMSWCLDCHRDPNSQLRRRDQLTNTNWTAPSDQAEFAKRLRKEENINPPTHCSGCHR